MKHQTVRSRRQRLGQHFLRDDRVAAAIVHSLEDEPPRVLEIGPGRGALTAPLLARFREVRAVELDDHLAATLAARLGNPVGLEVWRADALHHDLAELTRGGPWQVAGNLPYAVATPIVRRLLRCHGMVPRLVVMVQREVADRFLAPPDSAHRGLVSVEMEIFGRVERLFEVPASAFSPPPKVVSTVVGIDLHPPMAGPEVVKRALSLAGMAFTQRRKKLPNALTRVAPRDALVEVLVRAGCDPRWRPQRVESSQWLALAGLLPEPDLGG